MPVNNPNGITNNLQNNSNLFDKPTGRNYNVSWIEKLKKEAAGMDGGSPYHIDTDEIRKRMPALPVPKAFLLLFRR